MLKSDESKQKIYEVFNNDIVKPKETYLKFVSKANNSNAICSIINDNFVNSNKILKL